MSEYGDLGEDGVLRFVRILPGPIERVWSYIAEGEKRAQWLSGGGTATRAGEVIAFEFNHKNLTPHNEPYPEQYKELESGVTFQVTVVACDPPNLLQIDWPSVDGGDDSRVTFRLSKVADGVKLELEQERIPSTNDLYGASAGWHGHFAILEARLKGETPEHFWPLHERLMDEYRERFKEITSRITWRA